MSLKGPAATLTAVNSVGAEDPVNRLVASHGDRLFQEAHAILGDPDLAAEAVQELWVIFVEQNVRGKLPESPEEFLRLRVVQIAGKMRISRQKIARRLQFTSPRGDRGQRNPSGDKSSVFAPLELIPAQPTDFGEREAMVGMQTAISQLPPRLAQTVHYRLKGLTYPEIGEKMGISSDAVEGRMRRAILRLREVIPNANNEYAESKRSEINYKF